MADLGTARKILSGSLLFTCLRVLAMVQHRHTDYRHAHPMASVDVFLWCAVHLEPVKAFASQ